MFDALPKIVMYRHKSFHSRPEALEYLRSMAPAHAFFSVAYYERPDAGTMADKHWTGADLIFDLDADHLPDVPKSYPAMLANVKYETLKLLDFLTDDFGFSEDLIDVVFSGGRGYHIHVRDQTCARSTRADAR
jgi:DNA primase small subunit